MSAQAGSEHLAAAIEHTLLAPGAARGDIKKLCAEAIAHRFHAVCVNPHHAAYAVEQTAGSSVCVCATVGFPLGATLRAVKEFETKQLLGCGVKEIDMVLNIGEYLAGQVDLVEEEIGALSRLCRAHGAALKVIIETALLTTDDLKAGACRAAERAGADFVKTSTGFLGGGATVHDIALMRKSVAAHVGVKASGGIRDYQSAAALLRAGANRIGTSRGVEIITESRRT